MDEAEKIQLRRDVLLCSGIKDKNILDVGAGPLGAIAAKEFNCKVISIDVDCEKLNDFQQKALDKDISNITFEKEDATNLSYEDNSFDAVICYCVLHHVTPQKREKLIHELFRVTREKIVLSEFTTLGFNETHPDGKYIIVDLEWLKSILTLLGRIEEYKKEYINTYICHKMEGKK